MLRPAAIGENRAVAASCVPLHPQRPYLSALAFSTYVHTLALVWYLHAQSVDTLGVSAFLQLIGFVPYWRGKSIAVLQNAQLDKEQKELSDRAPVQPDTERVHSMTSEFTFDLGCSELCGRPSRAPHLAADRLSSVSQNRESAALLHLLRSHKGEDKRRSRTRTQNQWRRQAGLPHRAEICPCP